MSFYVIVLIIILSLFGCYIFIRLISKAVFKSYWEEKINAFINIKKNKIKEKKDEEI